jgi:hypothetical protein
MESFLYLIKISTFVCVMLGNTHIDILSSHANLLAFLTLRLFYTSLILLNNIVGVLLCVYDALGSFCCPGRCFCF